MVEFTKSAPLQPSRLHRQRPPSPRRQIDRWHWPRSRLEAQLPWGPRNQGALGQKRAHIGWYVYIYIYIYIYIFILIYNLHFYTYNISTRVQPLRSFCFFVFCFVVVLGNICSKQHLLMSVCEEFLFINPIICNEISN